MFPTVDYWDHIANVVQINKQKFSISAGGLRDELHDGFFIARGSRKDLAESTLVDLVAEHPFTSQHDPRPFHARFPTSTLACPGQSKPLGTNFGAED
jgi:hypothetical protein